MVRHLNFNESAIDLSRSLSTLTISVVLIFGRHPRRRRCLRGGCLRGGALPVPTAAAGTQWSGDLCESHDIVVVLHLPTGEEEATPARGFSRYMRKAPKFKILVCWFRSTVLIGNGIRKVILENQLIQISIRLVAI